MECGPHDRNEEQWKQAATEALARDRDLSYDDLLHRLYEQHEKSVDYRKATLANVYTKHVPIELQLLSAKTMASFYSRLAAKAEKIQRRVSWLTVVLVVLTALLAILTVTQLFPSIIE